MCWRPTHSFLFYQWLAAVAGRCLDWFSMNPDTVWLLTHTHTHTRTGLPFEPKPLKMQCRIFFSLPQTLNMMWNHSLHTHINPHFLHRGKCIQLNYRSLWVRMSEYVGLLNNSADITLPLVFIYLFYFILEGRAEEWIRMLTKSRSYTRQMCSLRFSNCYVREEPRLSGSLLPVCVFKWESHPGRIITAKTKFRLNIKYLSTSVRFVLWRRLFAAVVHDFFFFFFWMWNRNLSHWQFWNNSLLFNTLHLTSIVFSLSTSYSWWDHRGNKSRRWNP